MDIWVVGDGHLSNFQFWTIMKRAAINILEHAYIYYVLLCTKPPQQNQQWCITSYGSVRLAWPFPPRFLLGSPMLLCPVGVEGSRQPLSHLAAGVGCWLRYLASPPPGSLPLTGWAGFLLWQSQSSVPRVWKKEPQDILRCWLWKRHAVMSAAWLTQIQEGGV